MAIFSALICLFIGGLVNGSFALPTKNIQQWDFENVWLSFSLWAFLILPWAIILMLAPHHLLAIYSAIPAHILWPLLIGGLLFGVGQACFAQALQAIGLGLAFVLNIGIGTGLGFLLPLFLLHPQQILTPFGYATLLGGALITAGLLVYYRAGKQRDICLRQIRPAANSSSYSIAVLLAIVAGVCSAIQNFTFATTHDLQTLALASGVSHLAASIIIWPVFLTFSWIPYGVYMIFLLYKNKSFNYYFGPRSLTNGLLSLGMGIFWYGSLVLYSLASLLIGAIGPIVGWPLFMVMIILTSNFWGWRHHEWAHVSATVVQQAKIGVGLLILAVGVLAFSATLT